MARELHVLEAPGASCEAVAAARDLAAAVVGRAVRDLAGSDHDAARRWLCGPHARPWLEGLDLDQEQLLEALAPNAVKSRHSAKRA